MNAEPGSAPDPSAPPTTRPLTPTVRREPSWPQAFGIIAIIVGAMSGLIGLSSLLTMSMSQAFVPGTGQNEALAAAMRESIRLQGMLGIAKALVAPVLIIGGIGLIRRRRWGVGAALVWSVLKMVIGIGAAVAGVQIQRAVMSTMGAGASGPAAPAVPPPALFFGQVVGAAFPLVWEWAAPVFLLVWFMMPGVRATVREWNPAKPAAT